MVISNLNTKLIEDRLGFINRALARLKGLSPPRRTRFSKERHPAIAESYLRRSREAVFDVSRHIIAKIAGKRIIEYKEIAKTLGENGIVSRRCSDNLVLMAGYAAKGRRGHLLPRQHLNIY